MTPPKAAALPSVTANAEATTDAHREQLAQKHKAQQQETAKRNRAKAKNNQELAKQNRASQETQVSGPSQSEAASSSVTPQAKAKPTPKPAKSVAKKRQKKATSGAGQSSFKSKVVIRRLPPNLPEAIFWKAVSPWIRDASDCSGASERGSESASSSALPQALRPTVDFKSYLPGKLKGDPNKQDRHSRAYVRFLDPASLIDFHKSFDGHIFRDAKGNESVAIVEFAPYQRVAASKVKKKADPKQGTIDHDADYKAFLARLEKGDGQALEKKSDAELLASLVAGKEKEKEAALKKSTPLLEHLRALKAAKLESAAAAKKAKKAAAKAAAKSSADPAIEKKETKSKDKNDREAKSKVEAKDKSKGNDKETDKVKEKEKTKKKKKKDKGQKPQEQEKSKGGDETVASASATAVMTDKVAKQSGGRREKAAEDGAEILNGNQQQPKKPKKPPPKKKRAPKEGGDPGSTEGAKAQAGDSKNRSKAPTKKRPPKSQTDVGSSAPEGPADKIQILKRESGPPAS